jgi:pilus assembly protein CpaD
MITTQKALSKTKSVHAKQRGLMIATTLMLIGCGGGYASTQAPPPVNQVQQAHLQRTVLDAHAPTAIPVEARLVLPAADGVQGLTGQEYAQLTSFASDFVRLGRGNLVISVPANAGNSDRAARIAQDAQRALYAGGVDYTKISGGSYQAQGQLNAPVMLSFARFEAQRVICQPWTEVDVRKTANNLPPERFGCAQNANLAAMVADPGDLLGDRGDPLSRDAGRIQVGVEKQRKGEIPVVSASVTGGGQ